jgi:hypothetical protein
MSGPAQDLALRDLRRQAANAGLRLVNRGGGWALLILGKGGAIVGDPLPVRDLKAAAGVIRASLQVRAELGALAAILAAKHRARRGVR